MLTDIDKVYEMAALAGMDRRDIKQVLAQFDFNMRAQELTLGYILKRPQSKMKQLQLYRLYHFATQNENKHLQAASKEMVREKKIDRRLKYEICPKLLKWLPNKPALIKLATDK